MIKLKSILPKETNNSKGENKFNVVGPGTKVILLTPKERTADQNLLVPQEATLSSNVSSSTSTKPVDVKRPRGAAAITDKLSAGAKYESYSSHKGSINTKCIKEIQEKDETVLSPEDLQVIKDFIKSYMANPDILLTPQLTFYKNFIENLGAKIPLSTGNKDNLQKVEPKKRKIQWAPKLLEGVDASKDYQCNECEKVFISNNHLESHMKSHMKSHNDEKEKAYMCSICGKRFLTHSSLTTHMMMHTGERPYKCNQCDKAFRSNTLRLNHTRMIHTGVRPYKCNVCERAFPIAFKLKRHLLTHTGVKPYICTKCHKAFVTKQVLDVHMLIHTGERRYACEECGKTFVHSSSLTKHKMTHTGEKPFQCTQCDLSFAWKSNLDAHMRTHTGERPYQCNQCGNTFAQSYSLKKHKRTHTGETPYSCSHCDKKFKYRSTLNEHMKRFNLDININGIANKDKPIEEETQYEESMKYSGSINRDIKISSDNIEASNSTVTIAHMQNAEITDSPNAALLPIAGIQEYSCYPWYNGRFGWDTFQHSNIPDNKNDCLFRIEQSGTDNGIKRDCQ